MTASFSKKFEINNCPFSLVWYFIDVVHFILPPYCGVGFVQPRVWVISPVPQESEQRDGGPQGPQLPSTATKVMTKWRDHMTKRYFSPFKLLCISFGPNPNLFGLKILLLNCEKKKTLDSLGQLVVPHSWLSSPAPWQEAPPKAGGGASHSWERLWVPPPQVTEQLSHGVHPDQKPSTM